MKRAVVVFAKVPGAGNPKSRIAAAAGRARTDGIYGELLEATAAAVAGFDVFVAFFGAPSPGDLEIYFPAARAFLPQRGGTLGARLRNALLDVRDLGYDRLCAVGADCPGLGAGDITTAFELLDRLKDVVIGPAADGGYYLIALKDPESGAFAVEGWGTAELLARTIAALKKNDLPYALLPVKEDIDTLEAYERWKASLSRGRGRRKEAAP